MFFSEQIVSQSKIKSKKNIDITLVTLMFIANCVCVENNYEWAQSLTCRAAVFRLHEDSAS